MRCLSYCTASEYVMTDLANHLVSKGFVVQNFDDVLFAKMQDNDDLDIFLFPYGCFTVWGSDEAIEKLLHVVAYSNAGAVYTLYEDYR